MPHSYKPSPEMKQEKWLSKGNIKDKVYFPPPSLQTNLRKCVPCCEQIGLKAFRYALPSSSNTKSKRLEILTLGTEYIFSACSNHGDGCDYVLECVMNVHKCCKMVLLSFCCMKLTDKNFEKPPCLSGEHIWFC